MTKAEHIMEKIASIKSRIGRGLLHVAKGVAKSKPDKAIKQWGTAAGRFIEGTGKVIKKNPVSSVVSGAGAIGGKKGKEAGKREPDSGTPTPSNPNYKE